MRGATGAGVRAHRFACSETDPHRRLAVLRMPIPGTDDTVEDAGDCVTGACYLSHVWPSLGCTRRHRRSRETSPVLELAAQSDERACEAAEYPVQFRLAERTLTPLIVWMPFREQRVMLAER